MITRFVQEKSFATIFIMFVAIIAGVYGYTKIARESTPDIAIPILYVTLGLNGVSPGDAERLLVKPLESELASVAGVKKMNSTAYQGGGNIVLEFASGYDLEKAKEDTQEAIDRAEGQLPKNLENQPQLFEVLFSEFPIMFINLYGSVPQRTLQALGKEVQTGIESLNGILRVDFYGEREDQVEILLDPDILSKYNIALSEIGGKVARFNSVSSSGVFEKSESRMALEVPTLLDDAKELLNFPLVIDQEKVVRLGEVATVRRAFNEQRTVSRLNGFPTISLAVIKRSGFNTIATAQLVHAALDQSKDLFPPQVQYTVSNDTSIEVADFAESLEQSILTAVLLVMIVIVAFIGFKSGLLIAISIPSTILVSLVVLYLTGNTLNNVVMFALILAVGLLVDASIVVVEYAYREIENGTPIRLAYFRATTRTASPIIASNITTLAVFLPLLFWPGVVGDFMGYLPKTLIIVLCSSLVIALGVIPVIGSEIRSVVRFFTPIIVGLLVFVLAKVGLSLIDLPQQLTAIVPVVLGIVSLLIARRIIRGVTLHWEKPQPLPDDATGKNTLPTVPDINADNSLTSRYARVVYWITGSVWRSVFTLGTIVTMMVSILTVYAIAGKGIEFFPTIGSGNFSIDIHGRGNLSVSEMDRLSKRVEAVVIDYAKETGYIDSMDYKAGLFNNRESRRDRIASASIQLVNWRQRPEQYTIERDLKERVGSIPGLEIAFAAAQEGPPQAKPVWIEISGTDNDKITEVAQKVKAMVDGLPELVNVEDSLPLPNIKWKFAIDNNVALDYGVFPQELSSVVSMFTSGSEITRYRPEDSQEEVPVVARVIDEVRNLGEIESMMLPTAKGPVPVSQFLSRKYEKSTPIISRRDQKRVQSVKADVDKAFNTQEIVQKVTEMVNVIELPEGVSVSMLGGEDDRRESMQFLEIAFALAIFLIFIVLMFQFNSFYLSMTVLSAVVASFGGMFTGLLVFGDPFGIVLGGVGAISLAGIVVNNNIVLIDSYLFNRSQMSDFRQAIVSACYTRLRPILLTASTTVLGLIPMMFNFALDFKDAQIEVGSPSGAFWEGLARVIVFGLVFATPITIFFTPAMLSLREIYLRRAQRKENKALGITDDQSPNAESSTPTATSSATT